MTDRFQQAAERLAVRRKARAAASVTYSRSGVGSVTVSATKGETPFRFTDEYGMSLRQVMRDFLIDAADLVLDGSQVEPEEGDVITETINGESHTWEVQRSQNGEPCWRWSDPHGVTLRVHTQETSVS